MPKAKTQPRSSTAEEKEAPADALAQQKEELDACTMTHILSYLDSAGDVGRCAGLGKAWRQASNAPDVWAKVMEKAQPELAVAVLPLARRHLPPGGGEGEGGQLSSWHPKRLLKQHWRTARNGRPDDDAGEEVEEDKSWAARQRKEERRWQARFRDCYLQFTLNDGEKPNAAPILTKLLPISDGEALEGVFSGEGFGNDAFCLGTMQLADQDDATKDTKGKGKKKSVPLPLNISQALPRLLEATVSVHDWSGQEPKAAHLISGSKYQACMWKPQDADHIGTRWLTTLHPQNDRDSFKPPHAPGDGDFGFYHTLRLFPRMLLNGKEEMHEKAEDKERTAACKGAVAAATEVGDSGLHIHACINVLRMEYDEAEPMDMDTEESWRWLDATWAALDWK